MPKSLYYIVKFFDQGEHAEAFLHGEVYARKLSFFRDYEMGDRGDPSEGTTAILQPRKGLHFTITVKSGPQSKDETVIVTEEDLAGPITMGSDYLLQLNVFCMFGIYGDSPELETIGKRQQRIELPETCFREFGSHVVVIKSVRQFLDRVKKAADREGYQLWVQPVEYYDPSTFDGYMRGLQGAFRKPVDLAYQQELRIAFDTVDHPGPLTLNVGDLSDIGRAFNKSALRPGLREPERVRARR